MGTSPPSPPPPVPKRPCTMRCECNNGMLSLLLPHYHSTTATGATIVLLPKLVWCSFCLAWGERQEKRVLEYCHTVRWAPEKNNNSPQILAGHPNHRNERIPVQYCTVTIKLAGTLEGRKAQRKGRKRKKKGKKKTFPELLCAPLYATQTKKKKKRCV